MCMHHLIIGPAVYQIQYSAFYYQNKCIFHLIAVKTNKSKNVPQCAICKVTCHLKLSNKCSGVKNTESASKFGGLMK